MRSGGTDPGGALLIGYGNPLRGDDGVGWQIADLVAAAVPGLRVMKVHQLAPELAEVVAGHEPVVFVDASCEEAPGSVSDAVLRPSTRPPPGFTHEWHPSRLLHLARAVYGTAPTRAWLVTVGADAFGCGDGLSPAAREGACLARDRVVGLLGGAGQG